MNFNQLSSMKLREIDNNQIAILGTLLWDSSKLVQ